MKDDFLDGFAFTVIFFEVIQDEVKHVDYPHKNAGFTVHVEYLTDSVLILIFYHRVQHFRLLTVELSIFGVMLVELFLELSEGIAQNL